MAGRAFTEGGIDIPALPPPTRLPPPSWIRTLQSLLTPRTLRIREEAAVTIQCCARAWSARRHAEDLIATQIMQLLLALSERRAARIIQQHWWGRVRERALVRIQSAFKAHLSRRYIGHIRVAAKRAAVLEAERLVAEERATRARERARLLGECSAILEKQGRCISLFGVWEMVVWQERYVHVANGALIYQHINRNAEPKGRERCVPFKSMECIKVLLDHQLFIKCKSRWYIFKLGSRDDAERWATNLVQLAADSGCLVPGSIVLPPEESEGEYAAADIG